MQLLNVKELQRTEENLLLEVTYNLQSSFWSNKTKTYVREVFYDIKYGTSIFRDTGETTATIGLYFLLKMEADLILSKN